MKVLIVGNGGREHSLCEKVRTSDLIDEVYMAKGNGGTFDYGNNLDIEPTDIDGLVKFAKEEGIDLTIVGPEAPLCAGLADEFAKAGLKVFGPNSKASKLESSKDFSKAFMEKYDIKTAGSITCDSYEEAMDNLGIYGYPMVIKADGLCGGKGVYISEDEGEAKEALKEIFLDSVFGDEGERVVIEEFLDGWEASLICLVSGDRLYPMETAMDYKKIYEGDLGENTGGVGCLSPNPYWNKKLEGQSKEILDRISYGLKDSGLEYNGVLFIGFMMVADEIYVLEFNVRFGDPETEVLMPRLESDLVQHIIDAIEGNEVEMEWTDDVAMTTVLVSEGYPGDHKTGFEITGLDDVEDTTLYHNGTDSRDGRIYSAGGRVLSVTALGKDFNVAREKVYSSIDKIDFKNMFYRKDIGKI